MATFYIFGTILVASIVVSLICCCYIVYVNCDRNGISPAVWIFIEVITGPLIGSVAFILFFLIKGYRFYFKPVTKTLVILGISIILMIISTIAIWVWGVAEYYSFKATVPFIKYVLPFLP